MTMHGRTLKRSEKLNSCGVSDGCTIQVMSRMRGGGKHKDKTSKAEKKQTASGKTLEQKFVEEVRSDKGPAIRECDKDATVTRQESMSDVSQESQERDKDKMIHLLDEDSMKSWVEFWSKESDDEVGQELENWMSVLWGLKEVDHERAKSKSNGGSKSKSRTQDRRKASKASTCVSVKKNNWRRRKRKAQTSQRYRADWLRCGQAEEVQASSEGEVRGVGQTRSAEKAKERVTEERVSMKAKEENSDAKENNTRRGRGKTKTMERTRSGPNGAWRGGR